MRLFFMINFSMKHLGLWARSFDAYGESGILTNETNRKKTLNSARRQLHVLDNLSRRICFCHWRHCVGPYRRGSDHPLRDDHDRHTCRHRNPDRGDPYPHQGLTSPHASAALDRCFIAHVDVPPLLMQRSFPYLETASNCHRSGLTGSIPAK